MQVQNVAPPGGAEDTRPLEEMSALEAAIYLPSQYIQMLAGEKTAAVSRDELGFIVRRSDIQSVRAYVRESRALPVEYTKVVAWLGAICGCAEAVAGAGAACVSLLSGGA